MPNFIKLFTLWNNTNIVKIVSITFGRRNNMGKKDKRDDEDYGRRKRSERKEKSKKSKKRSVIKQADAKL